MFKLFKLLERVSEDLRAIRRAITSFAQSFRDWEESRIDEVETGSGVVKAKNLKPGWVVDGKEIVAVSGVLRNQVQIYFGGDGAVLALPSDALVLIGKEEQQ